MLNKVNLMLTQLVAFDLFLGYHVSNFNSRVNYFLLGIYKQNNIFNLNFTYSATKKFYTIFEKMVYKKTSIWLANENFSIFERNKWFLAMRSHLTELFFFNEKWYKGSLTNYKFVMTLRPRNFPHAVFFPNLENNHYLINECFKIGVPSFAISDSHVNPANVFFPIPGNSKSVRSTFFYYVLISKAALAGRYRSSSSFLLSVLRRSGNLILNSFNYNLNAPTYVYFKLFFRKYLLEEMIFLLNSKVLAKNIQNVFNFFISAKRLKKKEKLKGKKKFLGIRGRSAIVEWYLLRKFSVLCFQSLLFSAIKKLAGSFLRAPDLNRSLYRVLLGVVI